MGICLTGFSYVTADEYGSSAALEEQVLSLNASNLASMASFVCESTYKAKSQVIETHVVTIETLADGTKFHVGWYKDGYIATVLNGADKDLQMIVINEELVASSRSITVLKDHFCHKYSGGEVISYANRQMLKF